MCIQDAGDHGIKIIPKLSPKKSKKISEKIIQNFMWYDDTNIIRSTGGRQNIISKPICDLAISGQLW